jgi:circadian clock protein KaiB
VAAKQKKPPAKKKKPKGARAEWVLRLYIAGLTSKAVDALDNLKRICEEHLKGRYVIEVIDLLRNPALAEGDQILATPTLVRALPPPMKKIIGNLASGDRVLIGLDLRPGIAAEKSL